MVFDYLDFPGFDQSTLGPFVLCFEARNHLRTNRSKSFAFLDVFFVLKIIGLSGYCFHFFTFGRFSNKSKQRWLVKDGTMCQTAVLPQEESARARDPVPFEPKRNTSCPVSSL